MSNPENNEVLTAEQLAIATSILGEDLNEVKSCAVPLPVRPPFYIAGSAPVGAGVQDAYGTAYIVEKGGAIRRVGPKKPKL